MQNIICSSCGATYNPRTIEKCPLCKPELSFMRLTNRELRRMSPEKKNEYYNMRKEANKLLYKGERSEVDTFLKEEIRNKSNIVKSYRRSELSIKQSQKLGHKMLQQFRPYH